MHSKIILHPYAKVIVLILFSVGVFLTRNLIVLGAGYALIALLLLNAGQLRTHVKLLLIGNLPFLLLLLFVYAVVLKSRPVNGFDSGLQYAFTVFFRITILTAVWQHLLNVSTEQLFFFCQELRIKGSILVIVISGFATWKDFALKANRIITARLSRGYLKNRSFLNRLRQIPFVIQPLFTSTILLTLERSASWKQREMLKEIEEITNGSINVSYSKNMSLVVPLVSLTWFVFSVLNSKL